MNSGNSDSSILMQQSLKDHYPLHEAAKIGASKFLKSLLDEGKDPRILDFKNRTPLHWAGSVGHHRKAYECVNVLLKCDLIENLSLKDKREFIDAVDLNGETVLHLASKNEAKKTVEYLILAGADVNVKSKDGKEQLEIIYSKIPDAMIGVLNQFIEVWSGEPTDDDLVVKIDFGALIGYPSLTDASDGQLPKEIELLSYSLSAEKSAYKEVLVHPLVKIFLELKWKRVRLFFFLSIIFHVIWLLLLTTFVTVLYKIKCPYNPNSSDMRNETNLSSDNLSSSLHHLEFLGSRNETFTEDFATLCDLQDFDVTILYILLIVSIFVGLKELFQMCSVPRLIVYFGSLENLGQCSMVMQTFLVAWPIMSSSSKIYPWLYQLSAFAIFLAWTLILTQIGRIPSLEVYVLILARVLKSFSLFILTFSSLLIAFAVSFSIIFPSREEYDSFPLALLRVVIMMTGELEYMEVFHGEIKPEFPISGNIIYAFFVLLVTIILFNLLIGITINDIQGLQTNAEISRLSGKLKRIFLLESFLLSDQLQTVFRWFGKRHWLEKFLIIPSTSIDDFSLTFPIQQIDKEIQSQVRQLASINSSYSEPTT